MQGDHGGLTLNFVDYGLVSSFSVYKNILGNVRFGRDGMAKRPTLVLKGNHRILFSNTFLVEHRRNGLSLTFLGHIAPFTCLEIVTQFGQSGVWTDTQICLQMPQLQNDKDSVILIYETEPRLLLVSAVT